MNAFDHLGIRVTEPPELSRRNTSAGFYDDSRRVQRIRDLTEAFRRQVEHILQAETANDKQAMRDMDQQIPDLIGDIEWQLTEADRLLVRNEERMGDGA